MRKFVRRVVMSAAVGVGIAGVAGVGAAYALVSLEVDGQVLEITGTPDDDNLFLEDIGPGQVRVEPLGSGTALEFLTGCVEVMDGGVGTGVAECSGVASISASLKGDDDFIRVKSTLPAQIDGDDGADHLRGGSGNDDLDGGPGNDVIGGGAGDDAVRGGGGNDELYGNQGDDDLKGQAGDDRIDGGSGDDVIDGGGGDDYLFGFAGDDTMEGGPGEDWVDGGEGQDDIEGNGGADTLFGGPGVDAINGGGGSNTIEHDPPAPLVDVVAYGGIPNAATLSGGTTLAVVGGTLVFNDPDGNPNDITVIDDPGVPGALLVTDAGETPFVLGPGCVSSGASYVASCNGVQDIYLEGGGGDDVLEVSVALPASLSGGAGYDKLLGGGGPDVLDGGSQADVLDGRGGADELYGGDGDDRISGGAGVAPDGDLIFGGEGFDAATYYARLNPVSVTFDAQYNDGDVGEGDYVALDVERRGTNFVADDTVLAQGAELSVSPLAWSASDTKFAMSTQDDGQVVAFYEQVGGCYLTVAARALGSTTWSFKQLDWSENGNGSAPGCVADTHYNIRLAVDLDGFLHVVSGMHHSPMRYFRTDGSIRDDPTEVSTLTRHPVVDAPGYEGGVTYPEFFRTQDGTQMLSYRQPGRESIRASRFDPHTKTWSYIPDGMLFQGNPYRQHVQRDGWVHSFARFFRGGAMQSQTLAYVRTKDGLVYENANGQPVDLPVSAATTEAHIEYNSEGGIRPYHFTFDSAENPVVGYLVYDNDENGNTCPANTQPVLKARLAVFRNGQWLKKDIKCTDFAWVNAGPKFLNPGVPNTWFMAAPSERWLNGQRVYVVSTIIGNTAYGVEKEYFVLDWETLDLVSQHATPPGGEPAVVDWSDQCATHPYNQWATPVPSGVPPAQWVRRYEPGVGDLDSEDFYRLVHELAIGNWNSGGAGTGPTELRVKRVGCGKVD